MSNKKNGGERFVMTTFYVVVALVAGAGQVIAAAEWLHVNVALAVPAVAALELGGIALTAHADNRRQQGERALFARALSAAVAGFAVGFNWLGHADHMQGAFFAAMSALGYLTWSIHSGARRRDAMRAAGKLTETAPVYGLVRWVRNPAETWQARQYAIANPRLGLHGSLAKVRDEKAAKQRQAKVADVLGVMLRESGVDDTSVQLVEAVFDMEQIAAGVRRQAPYGDFVEAFLSRLNPARFFATGDVVAEVQAAPLPAPTSPAPVGAGIGALFGVEVPPSLKSQPRAPRRPIVVSGLTASLPRVDSPANPGHTLALPTVMTVTNRH